MNSVALVHRDRAGSGLALSGTRARRPQPASRIPSDANNLPPAVIYITGAFRVTIVVITPSAN